MHFQSRDRLEHTRRHQSIDLTSLSLPHVHDTYLQNQIVNQKRNETPPYPWVLHSLHL